MQDLQVNPILATRLAALQEKQRYRFPCFSFEDVWEYSLPLIRKVVTVNLGSGEIGAIAAQLGLGSQLQTQAFVLSLELKAEAFLYWDLCLDFGFILRGACVVVSADAEVPGGSFTISRIATCFPGGSTGNGGSGESPHETTRVDLLGGACADVQNDPVIDGIGSALITQRLCCRQPLRVEAEGTAFGGPFDFVDDEVGKTLPMCPASDISIDRLSFQNDHPIRKDALGTSSLPDPAPTIDDPVWQAPQNGGPVVREAVAYSRDDPLDLQATFTIDPPLTTAVSGVTIRGTASNGMVLEDRNVTLVGDHVDVSLRSNKSLGDHANGRTAHFSDFTIDWEVSYDGVVFEDAGRSQNELFVTWDDPLVTGDTYLTVLRLGVGNGNQATRAEVAAHTWTQFGKPDSDPGPTNITNWSGEKLYYYKEGTPFAGCVIEVQPLLTGDGIGRCGALARLLIAALGVNGIESTFVTIKASDPGEQLLVKSWEFGKPTIRPDPPYMWDLDLVIEEIEGCCGMVPAPPDGVFADLTNLQGIAGQNSVSPSQKVHNDHTIVRLPAGLALPGGKRHLDPSYGLTYEDARDFETTALDGYVKRLIGRIHRVRKVGSTVGLTFSPPI